MKFPFLIISSIAIRVFSFASDPPEKALNWEITPPASPVVSHAADFFIDAEFLYMFVRSSNMDWAQIGEVISRGSLVSPTDVNQIPRSLENFETSWDPGGRIGAGIVLSHDGWDLYANWTFFYNRINDSLGVEPFTLTGGNPRPQEIGTKFISLNNWERLRASGVTFFDRANVLSAFRLNQIDAELGRNFFISRWLSLRPYGGVRGALVNNHLRVNGFFNDIANGRTEQLRANFSQDFWGVGLLAGIKSSWFFVRNWALWGNACTALLYGKYDIDQRDTVFGTGSSSTISEDFHYIITSDFFAMQPIVEFAIGLRWQTFFKQDTYHILFDLGWETHIWLKHLAYFKYFGEESEDLRGDQLQGDISFSGLVLRGCFYF